MRSLVCSGKAVNVLDAYKEPRFDSSMDKKTGFRTKTILAVPIRSHRVSPETGGKIVLGVIQLINKKSGRVFKHRDVELLITVAEMLGHNLDRKQSLLSSAIGRRMQAAQRADEDIGE